MLAQTNATGIVRDLNNNALLANDKAARQAQRDEFIRRQEVANKMNDINIMKEQIQECLSLRDEIIEIKQMLYNHIQRDNKWQA
tara:strand:+ start:892 stop:1143 length:252 start_codon:yes stop_codon:yes gene_type:complete